MNLFNVKRLASASLSVPSLHVLLLCSLESGMQLATESGAKIKFIPLEFLGYHIEFHKRMKTLLTVCNYLR